MSTERRRPTRRFLSFFGAVSMAALAGCVTLQDSVLIGGPRPEESSVSALKSIPSDPQWFLPADVLAQITPGGAGGALVRVTNLNPDGPGSLRAAVDQKGPRIIVFEVGGVIDLGKQTLNIREPFVTIAGQTAPSPGITLIRGGVDVRTNDVVIEHIRIRPGDNGETRASGFAEDSIATVSARNIVVAHCSLTWAVDENLSASGPRFTGSTPDEWRKGTSGRLLYSYNLIAEGLADSTHPKFEHSKGSLIHDNIQDIWIYRNVYAHNFERSPLFKGGVRGAVVNNLIYDPGQRAVHYNLQAQEWGSQPFQTGHLTLIGNVLRGGPSTLPGLPLVMLGGDGDLDLYARHNLAVDKWGNPLPATGRYTTSEARIVPVDKPWSLPDGLEIGALAGLERHLQSNAGARPWDRDSHDVRVFANIAEGRGEIINSQSEVGGYPQQAATRRVFDTSQWDMTTLRPLTPLALDSGARSGGT